MKQLFVLVALLVLGTSCGKKKAREAAEAAQREEARQEELFVDNLSSLENSDEGSITYYFGQRSLGESDSMLICHLKKGTVISYEYQDTARKEAIPMDLHVPKFLPGNAYLPEGDYVIKTWKNPTFTLMTYEPFSNPAPIPLIVELGDNSLLTGGYIIAWDLGWGWFYFDTPGTIKGDLLTYADYWRDTFLLAENKVPAAGIVRFYKHDGKKRGVPLKKYFVKDEKSMLSYEEF